MPGMFQVVFASSTPCLHPHALKGQKLLAQGNTLGYKVINKDAL